ncbi:MAG: universal stress protein [Candidatus Brocadiales bacterium]|nr:universal stress protein [Candidatus Bathyanammoxibius sp.]MCQ4574385.1 universal stress protein [Candidatus Bathyanammoxibius amoris]
MIKMKTILCPIDYSKGSLTALDYAVHIALRETAKLYLIHVIDIRYLEGYAPLEVANPDSETINRLKKELDEHVPEDARKKIDVESIVTVGIPVLEIVNATKEKEVDVIVMGTHGRTGIAHVIMGSVAENVVRRAPCAVLTVRQP